MSKEKDEVMEALLEDLHVQVGEGLLTRISSGTASAQEYSAAIKFLKDNNIGVKMPNSNMAELSTLLNGCPIDDDEEFAPIRRIK